MTLYNILFRILSRAMLLFFQVFFSLFCFFLPLRPLFLFFFFFFNDPAPTEIYPLPLHDALPIYVRRALAMAVDLPQLIKVVTEGSGSAPSDLEVLPPKPCRIPTVPGNLPAHDVRSEEHTSELQSQSNLVCRLLLEKKKKNTLKL